MLQPRLSNQLQLLTRLLQLRSRLLQLLSKLLQLLSRLLQLPSRLLQLLSNQHSHSNSNSLKNFEAVFHCVGSSFIFCVLQKLRSKSLNLSFLFYDCKYQVHGIFFEKIYFYKK